MGNFSLLITPILLKSIFFFPEIWNIQYNGSTFYKPHVFYNKNTPVYGILLKLKQLILHFKQKSEQCFWLLTKITIKWVL